MILLSVMLMIVLIVAAIIALIASGLGVVFVVAFGDIIICALVITGIVKFIKKNRQNKK